MRQLILSLLLFCGTITAQTTYQQVSDLINQNLASGIRIQASKHREVEFALLDFSNQNSAQQYDIKAIYANSTYLGNNFDSSGLGKNLRTGWAICNGNNGTPNISNRVIVSYGNDFPTLNAVGGSKDAVVVAHSHKLRTSTRDRGDIGNLVETANEEEYTDADYTPRAETTTEGESGVGKNMQPYIVLVYIMKL